MGEGHILLHKGHKALIVVEGGALHDGEGTPEGGCRPMADKGDGKHEGQGEGAVLL